MHCLHKLLLCLLPCLRDIKFATGIIDGEKAPENSMPYMVSVQDNKGRHVCGGFLITEDFVLSSAHCGNSGLTHVVLGNHNLKKADHQKVRIGKKIIPENYQHVGHGNDIMLLQLSEKVRLGHRVQTVQLPPAETNLTENQVCQVAGWGKTKTDDNKPVDELMVVDVSVIDRQVCELLWRGLPADVTCAGGYKTTKGFCQGDSGAPLVCDGLAVGLVSFNYKSNCNYPDKPNVYTDISKHLRWINEVLPHHGSQSFTFYCRKLSTSHCQSAPGQLWLQL
ncbi:anionic trypsin-1-like [Oreochromis aureus]|uniref:anionic trypsin-1-like n=1 Tax=Oreochromis aureus TaxID=47969 RepID=UPI001952E9D1|nr:anionic trypsin-1-like [Oreochromis aureus]